MPSGCWAWTGAKLPRGYGRFYFQGRAQYSHRVALRLLRGAEVPDHLVVMHSCDNPWCVNPEHLSVGTQKENMRDASRKGRVVHVQSWRGGRNPKAKLSDSDCMRLLDEAARGVSSRALSEQHGITITRVQQIVRAAKSRADGPHLARTG
ncbi:HNH endonuclease signature motif containing protein [Stenotrophomonas sp.]|uniref:HNH endonuclease signature motif containing protein n=1 Tax=Stenotrophomonas sp. TaxID=69392 RepID=UPI0025CF60D1|nr:HNH endonuclease signature motif containing protein [Stenotrophomonas sp.]